MNLLFHAETGFMSFGKIFMNVSFRLPFYKIKGSIALDGSDIGITSSKYFGK